MQKAQEEFSSCVFCYSNSSVCIHWIPDLIHKIRKTYPDLEIRLMQGDYQDVCRSVKTLTPIAWRVFRLVREEKTYGN